MRPAAAPAVSLAPSTAVHANKDAQLTQTLTSSASPSVVDTSRPNDEETVRPKSTGHDTDNDDPAPSLPALREQLLSQARTIAALAAQRDLLVQSAALDRARWDADRAAAERDAEALVRVFGEAGRKSNEVVKAEAGKKSSGNPMPSIDSGDVQTQREVDLARQCAAYQADNRLLRDKLADADGRASALESELLRLRPLLAVQVHGRSRRVLDEDDPPGILPAENPPRCDGGEDEEMADATSPARGKEPTTIPTVALDSSSSHPPDIVVTQSTPQQTRLLGIILPSKSAPLPRTIYGEGYGYGELLPPPPSPAGAPTPINGDTRVDDPSQQGNGAGIQVDITQNHEGDVEPRPSTPPPGQGVIVGDPVFKTPERPRRATQDALRTPDQSFRTPEQPLRTPTKQTPAQTVSPYQQLPFTPPRQILRTPGSAHPSSASASKTAVVSPAALKSAPPGSSSKHKSSGSAKASRTPFLADARTEHLLLAARRIGRRRAADAAAAGIDLTAELGASAKGKGKASSIVTMYPPGELMFSPGYAPSSVHTPQHAGIYSGAAGVQGSPTPVRYAAATGATGMPFPYGYAGVYGYGMGYTVPPSTGAASASKPSPGAQGGRNLLATTPKGSSAAPVASSSATAAASPAMNVPTVQPPASPTPAPRRRAAGSAVKKSKKAMADSGNPTASRAVPSSKSASTNADAKTPSKGRSTETINGNDVERTPRRVANASTPRTETTKEKPQSTKGKGKGKAPASPITASPATPSDRQTRRSQLQTPLASLLSAARLIDGDRGSSRRAQADAVIAATDDDEVDAPDAEADVESRMSLRSRTRSAAARASPAATRAHGSPPKPSSGRRRRPSTSSVSPVATKRRRVAESNDDPGVSSASASSATAIPLPAAEVSSGAPARFAVVRGGNEAGGGARDGPRMRSALDVLADQASEAGRAVQDVPVGTSIGLEVQASGTDDDETEDEADAAQVPPAAGPDVVTQDTEGGTNVTPDPANGSSLASIGDELSGADIIMQDGVTAGVQSSVPDVQVLVEPVTVVKAPSEPSEVAVDGTPPAVGLGIGAEGRPKEAEDESEMLVEGSYGRAPPAEAAAATDDAQVLDVDGDADIEMESPTTGASASPGAAAIEQVSPQSADSVVNGVQIVDSHPNNEVPEVESPATTQQIALTTPSDVSHAVVTIANREQNGSPDSNPQTTDATGTSSINGFNHASRPDANHLLDKAPLETTTSPTSNSDLHVSQDSIVTASSEARPSPPQDVEEIPCNSFRVSSGVSPSDAPSNSVPTVEAMLVDPLEDDDGGLEDGEGDDEDAEGELEGDQDEFYPMPHVPSSQVSPFSNPQPSNAASESSFAQDLASTSRPIEPAGLMDDLYGPSLEHTFANDPPYGGVHSDLPGFPSFETSMAVMGLEPDSAAAPLSENSLLPQP
ncbi:hypothetical protein HGRIS_010339 [Hohenbuehelia grisea]|uniref:Proteophosphoglycan ppg4 n=1 Tax=Hohenbuehelia grisea TaxID=104357 RepID=A0ABR3J402_9AGAR